MKEVIIRKYPEINNNFGNFGVIKDFCRQFLPEALQSLGVETEFPPLEYSQSVIQQEIIIQYENYSHFSFRQFSINPELDLKINPFQDEPILFFYPAGKYQIAYLGKVTDPQNFRVEAIRFLTLSKEDEGKVSIKTHPEEIEQEKLYFSLDPKKEPYPSIIQILGKHRINLSLLKGKVEEIFPYKFSNTFNTQKEKISQQILNILYSLSKDSTSENCQEIGRLLEEFRLGYSGQKFFLIRKSVTAPVYVISLGTFPANTDETLELIPIGIFDYQYWLFEKTPSEENNFASTKDDNGIRILPFKPFIP